MESLGVSFFSSAFATSFFFLSLASFALESSLAFSSGLASAFAIATVSFLIDSGLF